MAKNCVPTEMMSTSVCEEELDSCSIISFGSNRSQLGGNFSDHHHRSHGQSVSEIKVETVYSLLSMLTCNNIKEEMCNKFYFMSLDPKMSAEMRHAGCLPLLIQLIHPIGDDMRCVQYSSDHSDSSSCNLPVEENACTDGLKHSLRILNPPQSSLKDLAIRSKACVALRNIIKHTESSKTGKREMRVLQLLEEIRSFSDKFKCDSRIGHLNVEHPGEAASHLMKVSFDEEHRNAICLLGGLHAIAELVHCDTAYHGENSSSPACVTVRRYAFMALTNLTFGDGTNKSILCSNRFFIRSLIEQLHSPSEELRQVTASVLRNLSWKADEQSKAILREMGAVPSLMKAALEARKESTLKSILSALWNLSAHSTANKAEICTVEGALEFLVSTFKYQSTSNSMIIVENGGGILRNISSYIARHEHLRAILREHDCLAILLEQLKSSSLTVVSNACATLWNLSARCPQDQLRLLELGAVPMLRNLVNSKHKMISMGSVAALKNLSGLKVFHEYDSNSSSRNSSSASNQGPSLTARKTLLFRPELDESLSEICDSTDSPTSSPFRVRPNPSQPKFNLPDRMFTSFTAPPSCHHSFLSKSSSKDSLRSTHSEPVYPSSFNHLPRSCHRQFQDYLLGLGHENPRKPDRATSRLKPQEEFSQLFHAQPIRINDANQANDAFAHQKSSDSTNAEKVSLVSLPRDSPPFSERYVPSFHLPGEASSKNIEAFNALKKLLFDEIQSGKENIEINLLKGSDSSLPQRERLIEHLESANSTSHLPPLADPLFRRSFSDSASSAIKEEPLGDYEAEREEYIEYISPETRKISHESKRSDLISCESRSVDSLDPNTLSEHKEDPEHFTERKRSSSNRLRSEKESKVMGQTYDELNSGEYSLGSKQSEETQDESGFAGSSSRLNESFDEEEDEEDSYSRNKPIIISEQYKRHIKEVDELEKRENIDVRRSKSVNFFRLSPAERLRSERQMLKSSHSVDKFHGLTRSTKYDSNSLYSMESNDLNSTKPPSCMEEAALSLESNKFASFEADKNDPFDSGPKLSVDGFLESTNPPSDMDAISGVSGISSSCGSLNSLDFDGDFDMPVVKDLPKEVTDLIKKHTQDIIRLTESHRNSVEDERSSEMSGNKLTKRMLKYEEQQDDSEDDSRATYICSPKIGPRIVKPVMRSRSVKRPPQNNANVSTASTTNNSGVNKSKSLVIKGTKTTALRANRSKPGAEGSNETQNKNSNSVNSMKKSAMNTKTFVVRKRNGSIPENSSSNANPNRDRPFGSSSAYKTSNSSSSSAVHKSSSSSLLSNSTSSSSGLSPVGNPNRRPQVQRRIASLWKRSSVDKPSPSSANLADRSPRQPLKKNSSHTKETSSSSTSCLLRSSTYEKLPGSEKEAIRMGKAKEAKENRTSISRNKVRPSEDNLSGVFNRSLRLEKKKISDPK